MKKISLMVFLFLCFIAPKASASLALWADNGHYYDFIPFVSSSLTWQESASAATGSTHLGANGYLATITSANENSFLLSSFGIAQNSQFAWIAGYEPNDDGVWKWAFGPETGTQFSQGVNPTAPFNYANWGGIEPNDRQANEDYLMVNIGNSFAGIAPGQWADAEPVASQFDPVVGYFVEYDVENQSNVVPEPATLLLFGSGLVGGAFVRRKRKV